VPLYRLDQLEPVPDRANATRRRLDCTGSAPRRGSASGQDRARHPPNGDGAARPVRPAQLAAGFGVPPDTPWQRELESAFLYEDTPDQPRASEEVKRTWSVPARWIGSWWATWGTARPRSRCAPPSKRTGGQAGRGPGPHHDSRRATRAHLPRAARRLSRPDRGAVAVPAVQRTRSW